MGGGVYGGYAVSPLSEAWMLFGEANGAASFADLQRLVNKDPGSPIGCTIVRSPVFFERDDRFQLPPDWSPNPQTGKRYDMTESRYVAYFADLLQKIAGATAEITPEESWYDEGPVFGTPRLTPTRLRQNAFHAVVLTAYQSRCAITGSKILPALQAAHIRPVTKGDGGYLGVDPAYRLHARLRGEFGNGEQFYAQAGEFIALPQRRADRPQREFLEWHLDTVFKAS